MERGDFSTVKGAQVGSGTVIRGHCNIFGSKIGKDCKIGAMVYMEPGVRIGDRTTVRPLCHLCDGVTIGNDVFVGPSVCATNDLYPSALHVKPLTTQICDGAVIGAGAVLLPVCIGYRAFVAAGAVVTRDVPDYAVVAGSPAKVIGSTKDASFVKKQKMRDAGRDPRADPTS